ncbi:unnamed protein product [Lymnaea stagnalis]|uniref:Laminin G domain-containing protein n=1 Tax=Lymnaea stagnalis TaxID=6523 RepID=A0AAV2H6B8_LYMST
MAEKSNADSATNLTAAKLAATNTNIIYSSNAAIVMPARDTLPFPTGVTNYGNGVTVLNSLLSTIPLLIDSITPDISQSEAYVVTLGDDLKELNSTYQNITSVGKLAVATMKNFDNVIRDINSSVAMATNAEQLIKEVQGNMSGTALDLLQEQYGTERNISEELRNTIMELDYQPQVLQNAIDTAMSRLDKEVSQWQVADAALSTLTTAALNLNTQIKGSQINSVLKVATQKVQNALATAESVAGSVTTQESTLHQKQGEIEIIQKDIIRAQDMQQSVQQALKNHQTEDDAFKQNVSQASSLLQKSDQSIKNIDNKIKDLEIKMEEAEVLLNQLRQPLNFDGNLSLQIKNPEANRPHLYDELVLDMRKPGNFTDGVVVFVDNPTTAAELQVGVASNKVFFEFNNGAQIVRVSSRAEICDVCWARVAAFRYAAVGYLTVTMISTGAVVADSRAGLIDSNARNLTLTSNLYVGSLPKDLETSKVTNRWFLGCLHNIVYQSQDVSLWTTSLTTSNPPKCCQTPPALPAPFTTPGLSFDGFGHITLYPGRLLFSDFKQFSLELRTFSTEATLFTVSSPDKKTVFSITVSAKAVVWTILNDGVQYKLVSPLQIATGKWAQILAMRDGNEIRLAVRYLDDPDSLVVASQTTTFFQLNRLDGRNLIFGLNSETLETGYGKANFAGCVRNISITTSTETHRPTFPDSVLESSGVKTDGCYLNVVEGLGFTSEASYAQFPTLNQLQQMKTLEFDIITTQSNGMLLYISGEGTMRFLYMAVIGGNVILVYRQNDTGSVISSGYYISDGQKHTVRVDFLTFRVALKVDDIYVEAGQTLSLDYLSFPANAVLILGGVPPTVELPPDCPVKQSIIGGFSRLVLNSGSIAFSEMNFTAQMDITLGGIIAPSGSTTAPLVNVSQMVICASKPVPSLLPLSDGVLFSGNDGLVWNSVIEKKIIEFFEGSFTMNIDLAVYKADGVLLYVADLISSPTTYFTIYIMDGILHQAMRTSLGTALDVKLSKAINDGQKHQIHLMRNNDHVALSFDNSTKDYVNNNQNGNVTSNFTFPTTNQVYLGALGTYNIMTSPLPQSFQSQPTKAYFAGAIYNLEIQDTPSTIETLHFSNLNRNLFGPVAKSVYYGISLTGVNSYLPLGVASTWDSLTIEMTLTTVSNSGLLMLIYENANKFLAMDLKNNQIRIHLPSSSVSGGQPLTITLDTSSNLCNGVIHSLQLQFVNSLVKLTADNQVRAARSIPDSYKLQALSNAQLFVGGVTGQFQGLPQELTTASLSACIMSVSLSNQGLSIRNFDPTQYVLTNSTDYGASYSCPH